MRSETGGYTVSRSVRASSRFALSFLLASSAVCITNAGARADDAATLQRLEAKIQQLEERQENEIKTLQAEVKRLRKQKLVATAAASPPPAAEPPRSALLPPGLPPPAVPAKVPMTYD
ncbi:hypothetical protein, partial [Bradyrhizobium sp.]|uniref:hypothetical protein n=1 Tax=Bradyrhizobium sp. TaxID=376 RepID=UPI003C6FEF37